MDETSTPQPVLEMTQQSPGTSAPLLDEFRITDAKAIGSVLRELMNRKEFLTVQCRNRSHRIVSCILEVNQADGYFVFDGSPEPGYNQTLMDSEENYFSATEEGIRIHFIDGRPQKYEFDGKFALRSRFPEALYRMQQREFFRIKAPLTAGYHCTAIMDENQPVTFDVIDLSVNGVRLRSSDKAMAKLSIGTVLVRAVLRLGKQSPIETDIKIMNSRIDGSHFNPVYNFGCRFENLPRAREMELQRFINKLALTRRNLETKNG